MPKTTVNRINLYYEVHGEGYPLVLSHGFAGTTRMWQDQIAALSREHRLILYDMRGHGQSDSPSSFFDYSLDLLVSDLYELLRHLGVERAVVGGLSLGGYISLHFYHQHPDMVSALLLIDTGPGFRNEERARQWNRGSLEAANMLESQGIDAFAASEHAQNLYYTPRDLLLQQNAAALANIYRRVMVNPFGVDRLKDIAVPALVVVGERDTDFLPAAEYMAARIPNAEKAVVAGAGHGVNIDQPEAFNSLVLGFLQKIGL